MTTPDPHPPAPGAQPSETPRPAAAAMDAALDALRQQAREATAAVIEQHGREIEALRAGVHDGLHQALAGLRRRVAEVSGDHPTCLEIVDLAATYADPWLWKFRDVPFWAVALEPDPRRLRHRVASCGLVLLTLRAAGDLLARHFEPRSGRPTMLVTVERGDGEDRRDHEPVDSGHLLLAALLLCFEGVGRLVEDETGDDPDAVAALRQLTAASRRVVLGMVLERAPGAPRGDLAPMLGDSEDWRCVYSAIDPRHRSPLYPFLEPFHRVAGHVVAGRVEGPLGSRRLGEELLGLGRIAKELPAGYRNIALLRLGELIDEARRTGLLTGETAALGERAAEAPLAPSIDLPAVVDRFGRQGVEEVPCPICGEAEYHTVFEKQGFPVVRCRRCRHLYVTPRLRRELREQIDDPGNKIFPELRRAHAGFLCRLLSANARGRRLLDIGCGEGHLLREARAFGFEAYGIDRSAAAIAELAPDFGRRLHQTRVADEALPWGRFDVVVMSHVLEHFPDPVSALGRVRHACNPGALLYVATADMDGLDFRIFGKTWEVIQPVVRYQYFTDSSLVRLLERCGFAVESRVDLPADPRPAPWMELFRRLGGSDSSTLALLARVSPANTGAP